MKIALFVIVALVCAMFLYEAYRVYRAFQVARPIIATAVAYEQQGDGRRYLFAGESTGVGTGAARSEESVAGRLGTEMPQAYIKNISSNGARISDLLVALNKVPAGENYDSVILLIGGNDILNFSSTKTVRETLSAALKVAKSKSGYVYLMTTGDVGNAPAFGPVLSYLYSVRSGELRNVFMEESQRAGVIYVDLFSPAASDPFAQEPLKYHAADGVHPSSEGYAVWYGKLKTMMK